MRFATIKHYLRHIFLYECESTSSANIITRLTTVALAASSLCLFTDTVTVYLPLLTGGGEPLCSSFIKHFIFV